MGSASSKDHDANPHDLGQNVSGMDSPRNKSQYPLAHHPQYGHTQSDSDNSMNGAAYGVAPPGAPQYIGGGGAGGGGGGGAGGPHSQRQYHGDSRDNAGESGDAMEVDQSSAEPPYSSSSARNGDSEPSNSTSIAPVSDVVPMVFRWEHGGRNVYITGTFNGWSKQCPMHRSGNDFTYIANLTRGKHAYKFVVDEEWRFAPDQLTVADVEGNVNNFVDVSDFQALSDFDFVDNKDADENQYGRFIPDVDEYTKEPPPLPPHLRHIILNKLTDLFLSELNIESTKCGYAIAPCATTRGAQPSLLYSDQRRHDGAGRDPAIQAEVCDHGLLQLDAGHVVAMDGHIAIITIIIIIIIILSPVKSIPVRSSSPNNKKKTAWGAMTSCGLFAGWISDNENGENVGIPEKVLHVDLRPEKEEQRAKAQQNRGNHGKHELEKKVLLGRDGLGKKDRHDREAREQQHDRERSVHIRVHGAVVWDLLFTTSTRTAASVRH